MQQIIQQVIAYVQQHHAQDYSGHDFAHIQRVHSLATKIAHSEAIVDLYNIELAALLHDVDDYKLGNVNTSHAETLMRQLGISQDRIMIVLNIIDSIGFSKTGFNPQLTSLEAKIVYDADKLDSIGAIGIARAFAYGGNKNRVLFQAQQMPQSFNLDKYRKNSLHGGDHSINHFFDKLLHLVPLMQTKLGRELARQRQQTMLIFLQNFFAEQDLNEWQQLLNKIQINQALE